MKEDKFQKNLKKFVKHDDMSDENIKSISEMTLMEHLLELRSTIIKIIIVVMVAFLLLFPFANDLYTLIAKPLTNALPADTSMIATAVASPFLTPFKLTLLLSIYLTMPYSLYQFWTFIAPGLYKKEKKIVMPIMFSSTVLFYLGAAFAYWVVFPLVFTFFNSTVPDGVKITTDISAYLDFVVKIFFAFGIAFEIPIITIILILTNMIEINKLQKMRPYIIVVSFIAGMLLTPPDVISQSLLAIPMWLLFEIGLIIAKYIKRDK